MVVPRRKQAWRTETANRGEIAKPRRTLRMLLRMTGLRVPGAGTSAKVGAVSGSPMSDTPTLAPVDAPKPLGRSMKHLGGLFLALSAATPASSVFVIVPDVLAQAGAGALISMIAAAFIALSVGQVYAETSSAFPLAGGEYAIVGRTLGHLPGFALLGLHQRATQQAVGVLSMGIGV